MEKLGSIVRHVGYGDSNRFDAVIAMMRRGSIVRERDREREGMENSQKMEAGQKEGDGCGEEQSICLTKN
jgi:hypothetical protein